MLFRSLKPLGIVDEIVPEPLGGAHTDPQKAAQLLDPVLEQALRELCQLSIAELLDKRYQKFRLMGQFFREASTQ